jgi:uncharacterized membrane protein YdjX (TVP38/TMEM64 family)
MLHGEKAKKTFKTLLAVLKFALLIGIVVGVPLLIWLRNPDIIHKVDSIEKVNAFLDEYQGKAALVYIVLQIAQVIISIIPGQPIQFAAGYAFSFFLGFLLSIIGIAIGTVLTFYLGRLLGKDMIYLIFGEKRLERFIKALGSKKGLLIIFLIYLFPGIPKDLFAYAAGISKMRCLPFLGISMVARTPALLCSIAIGMMVRSGSYVGIIIVAVVVLAAAAVSLVNRKRFLAWIDRQYEVRGLKG